MSPTPVTMASPVRPASYTWEATSEQVAARYGIPVERIVRFDLNTSPEPPELAARVLAAGRFESSLSEYPPSDYRRLVDAAARRYGVAVEEILVGAGADEVLDLLAKAFLPAGSAAVIPTPTYAMYRVLTEQRAARVLSVARRGAADGFALDGMVPEEPLSAAAATLVRAALDPKPPRDLATTRRGGVSYAMLRRAPRRLPFGGLPHRDDAARRLKGAKEMLRVDGRVGVGGNGEGPGDLA